MFVFKFLLNMPRFEAIAVVLALVAAMGYTIISLEWLPHMSVVTAIVVLLLYGLMRGLKYQDIQNGVTGTVGQGMGTIYLFFFTGLMVNALMISGAIPTLMYYGSRLAPPTYFYSSVLALCSVIGISTDSSLTTCATIGVAFIGIAAAFRADMAMTIDAIVSDAFFGDKVSPLSDTTSIPTPTAGTDLFEHIENMMYIIVSAWLISAVSMLWLSPNVAAYDMNSAETFHTQLEATGLVHAYSLIPPALLVILALMRANAIMAMLFTVVVALIVTYFHSVPDLKQLGVWSYSGYKLEGEALRNIARLILCGGLESISFTQTIVVPGMSLGGLLFSIGVIPSLLEAIHAFLTNAGCATFSVAMTSVGVNFLIGGQYLSTLFSDGTFKPVYDKLGLHSRNLTRMLEGAGMVINSLVPWSVCGVFISHALGVLVQECLPYAFFCYLSLALTLVFGWAGLTLGRE